MEKIVDLMIHILSPVIISEDFDLLSELSLNQSFEIFEVLKDLGFFTEKVDPSKTWEIIKKNDTKTRIANGWMWKRTHKVILDKI